MVKLLEQKLDRVVESVNQHLGLLFKNEREIGSMVYTNSVRISVMRRIIREHLKIDDVAFDALVDQELAKRKADDEAAQKEALKKAKADALEKAAEEAKAMGVPEDQVDDSVAAIETREFGGDFGEEHVPDGGVEEEAADQADAGDEPDGGGAEESEGPVGEAGPDAGGVQQVAGGGEEGQPADPV